MNFERKQLAKKKKRFYRLHQKHKSKNLKKMAARVYFLPSHSQPDRFINSFCATKYRILPRLDHFCGLSAIRMRLLALHCDGKNL